jgi:hypothetical protein
MYRAAHPTTRKQSLVGRVDDGINIQCGDIGLDGMK